MPVKTTSELGDNQLEVQLASYNGVFSEDAKKNLRKVREHITLQESNSSYCTSFKLPVKAATQEDV